jgi:glutaminyl-tRNA synthetase
VAQEFGGRCHLRFDDTNPTKEEQEYIDAIKRDVRWLGFDWGEHLYHASDYFEQLYEWAEHLIRAGKAYVDDQSQEEIGSTAAR